MRQFLLILIGLTILFFNTSNSSQICDDFDGNLGASYEAAKKLSKVDFHFNDSFETEKIFGMREASFYSCDNEAGYMVVNSGGKLEVHKNIPVQLWNQLKTAKNVDNFYKSEIKSRDLYTYR